MQEYLNSFKFARVSQTTSLFVFCFQRHPKSHLPQFCDKEEILNQHTKDTVDTSHFKVLTHALLLVTFK